MEKDISETPVAWRLSWGAGRQTTRPEDMAYCLLGLFGITLPLSYGEGAENAFYRLQEEIMMTTVDMSLFAWGCQFHTNDSAQELLCSPGGESKNHQDSRVESCRRNTHHQHLFASSPDAFFSKSSPIRTVNFLHLRRFG